MKVEPSKDFMARFAKSAPKSDSTKDKARAVGGSKLAKAFEKKKKK